MREIKFRVYDKNWEDEENSGIRYDITGIENIDGKISGVFLDGDFFDIEEIEIMQYTGIKDKNGKEIYEGDIVKVPVRRCGKSYGNWWQEKNDNHGWTGDFVYKKIISKNNYDRYNDIIGGFIIEDLPITKLQIKEIAKPRGKERTEQNVDTYNFNINDLEVIGNIYDNPELLEKEDE